MAELRKVFYQTIAELMKKDDRVVYLDADLAGALGTAELFREFPRQAFDLGIMEANMIGVGAGMSIKGKIPLCTYLWSLCVQKSGGPDFSGGLL